MSQHYVGVKQVFAWPEEKEGRPGYHVVYDRGAADEYHSWSPKDKFERAYLPLGEGNDGSTITPEVIAGFLDPEVVIFTQGKTTIVHSKTVTGYEMVDASSCVDPKNYSEQVGAEICCTRAADKIWGMLGFVLQWARNGIGR